MGKVSTVKRNISSVYRPSWITANLPKVVDYKMSLVDVEVYALIYDFTCRGDNWFEYSAKFLGENMLYTENGIRKVLDRLFKNGLLRKTKIRRDGFMSNVYHQAVVPVELYRFLPSKTVELMEELAKKAAKNDAIEWVNNTTDCDSTIQLSGNGKNFEDDDTIQPGCINSNKPLNPLSSNPSCSYPSSAKPASSDIHRAKDRPPAKNHLLSKTGKTGKKRSPELYILANDRICANYGFSEELLDELHDFNCMLAEMRKYIPAQSLTAQLAQLDRLRPEWRIEVVNKTVCHGWASLMYEIEAVPKRHRSTFDTGGVRIEEEGYDGYEIDPASQEVF